MNQRWIVRPSAALVLISALLVAVAPIPALAEDDAALTERLQRLEAKVEQLEKQPGLKVGGFRFVPYGYVKVDAVYDSSRVLNGDFYAWVLQETARPSNLAAQSRPDNNAFSLTANQTRLDLKVIAPKYDELEVYGLVEIDFYGNVIDMSGFSATGGPENKPAVLVRHAYIELTKGTWGLILGQTSDPISPLVEDTWNYFVGWMAGNPGYRRPQIRIIKDVPLPDGSKLTFWTGAMRTIENVGFVQAGEASGFPTGFARVAYHRPMLGRELMIGLDGHFGREDAENATASGSTITPGDLRKNIKSWSGNVELIVPMPHGLWFKGEGYYGSVMGSYFGGIGQSFTTVNDTITAVHSWGGWGQLGWEATDKLRFHAGASIDNPRNSDLPATTVNVDGNLVAGGRSLNRVFYGNFMYNITPSLIAGYEITQAMTQYKAGPNGIDLRHQVSAMYKF